MFRKIFVFFGGVVLNIGCHLSVTNGLITMLNQAKAIGANTLQMFAGNPRGFASLKKHNVAEFRRQLREYEFAPIIVHAPYVVNLCSASEGIVNNSKNIVLREIMFANQFPGNYYNIHPGCHVGQGTEKGIELVISALDEIMPYCDGTTLLIETMSGKGSEIGKTFEEVRDIISGVRNKSCIGVCLDTCHIFAAGYDIKNKLDDVVSSFEHTIGLQYLKAIHLNDSMMPFASHKDRHACIGSGHIGISGIVGLVTHNAFNGLPFILETPNDIAGYEKEIRILKSSVLV